MKRLLDAGLTQHKTIMCYPCIPTKTATKTKTKILITLSVGDVMKYLKLTYIASGNAK